jgi:hypothetical protein
MRRIDVRAALATLESPKPYAKELATALARGRIQLKAIAKDIEAAEKTVYSEPALEYIQGKYAIGDAHAKRGEDGTPTQGPHGLLIADPAKYQQAIKEYDAKHAEAKALYDAQTEAWNAYLAEEVSLVQRTVSVESMPSEMTVDEAELFVELLGT